MLKNKLFMYKNKTITIDEIMGLAGKTEYEDFTKLINGYVEEKILEPVISNGKNGRRPALYNKYRINKPGNDYSDILEEIKMLHPIFAHSKYSKHPDMYIKNKKEINLLSKFLWENEELLKNPMSINERSFQIWGAEKLLKDKSVIDGIFKYNEQDLSLLNYYETPEPFFEYIFSNEKEMNILIIENKDTWFSIRKIMREDGLNHLFRDYHVLLYGEGKKIISRNDRFKEYDNLLNGSVNTYYYFGDLDYEGIEIYQTLLGNNGELNICLCKELYSLMLKESKKYNLPETKEGQKKTNIDMFLNNFNEKEKQDIKEILEKGFYIPQEILNYQILKREMKEGLTR